MKRVNILLLGLLLCVVACQDDIEQNNQSGTSDRITFSAHIGNTPTTKARDAVRHEVQPIAGTDLYLHTTVELMTAVVQTKATSANETSLGAGFGVFAYKDEDAEPFMKGIKVGKQEDKWLYTGDYIWSQGSSYEFYGVYPYINQLSGDRTISYMAKNDPAEHYDLMVASATVEGAVNNQTVDLEFNHQLSKIVIKIDGEDENFSKGAVILKKIAFGKVKNAGSYSMKNETWTLTGDVSTIEHTYPEGKNELSSEENEAVFMMLPQESTEGFIEITLLALGKEVKLSANISKWEAGYSYTYTISYKNWTPSLQIQENANSYIINPTNLISLSGQFTIPLEQVRLGWNKIIDLEEGTNPLTDLTPDKLEIITLWKTWDGGDITGEVVGETSSWKYSFAQLNFGEGIPTDEGNNAVIALVNKKDKTIYWSWHLWLTDYNPDAESEEEMNGQIHQYAGDAFKAGGIYEGKYMMDRNLGATITGVEGKIDAELTAENAPKYFGLLYQFGRKDPFIGATATSGTIAATIFFTDSYAYKAESGGSLSKAVNNPFIFYAYNGNWITTGDATGNTDLWNEIVVDNEPRTAKSVFDPCPPGWRVPIGGNTDAYNPWSDFNNGDDFMLTSGLGRLYSKAEDSQGKVSSAWYPFSGYRYSGTGNLTSVGSEGSWRIASKKDKNNSLYFRHVTEEINPVYNHFRAHAFSVRCVQANKE